jgi:hypothetical protein
LPAGFPVEILYAYNVPPEFWYFSPHDPISN